MVGDFQNFGAEAVFRCFTRKNCKQLMTPSEDKKNGIEKKGKKIKMSGCES